MNKIIILIILSLFMIPFQGCSSNTSKSTNDERNLSLQEIRKEFSVDENNSIAVFSGGCFWCVEKDLETLNGVEQAISGYTSNSSQDQAPAYEEVASGTTNFRESVAVIYDSQIVSYKELITHFLLHHDPTDENGSFYDRGFQYTSAIYYESENERQIAQELIAQFEKENVFSKPIVTSIEPLINFYKAEKYHQNYYKKRPLQYNAYRYASGRDRFIESIQGEVDESSTIIYNSTRKEE